MTLTSPHLYSLPLGQDWLKSLGTGMSSPDMGKNLLILPNDRACQELRDVMTAGLAAQSPGDDANCDNLSPKPAAQFLPRIISYDALDREPSLALANLCAELDQPQPQPQPQPGDSAGVLSDLARQLWLAGKIRELGRDRSWQIFAQYEQRSQAETMQWHQALGLAESLVRLIDEMELAACDWTNLYQLAPENFAEHWQKSLQFFKLIAEKYPGFLADQGKMSQTTRLGTLLKNCAAAMTDPATASSNLALAGLRAILASMRVTLVMSPQMSSLMLRWVAAIARAPQGQVIMPGFDLDLADAAWQKLPQTHPQYGYRDALRRMNFARAEVRPWPHSDGTSQPVTPANPQPASPQPASPQQANPQQVSPQQARARLFSSALDPTLAESLAIDRATLNLARQNLQRIDCPHPLAEAEFIARQLYQAWQQPPKRAALVTPDRELARRVTAELFRYGLIPNDSGGVPILETPPGVFMRLILAAAEPEASAVTLLALLKHPFCTMGRGRTDILADTRVLERKLLRGPRLAPGLLALRQAFERKRDEQAAIASLNPGVSPDSNPGPNPGPNPGDAPPPPPASRRDAALSQDEARRLEAFITQIDQCLGPLERALRGGAGPTRQSLGQWHEIHLKTAFALSQVPSQAVAVAVAADAGDPRLYKGEDGKKLQEFMEVVRQNGAAIPELPGAEYPAVFEALARQQISLRRQALRDARIFIWGLHEAHAKPDLVILAGLNEQTWPQAAQPDPWLNRPMRQKLGLTLPEAAISQDAFDFGQYFTCDEVIITRSLRVGGEATQASRFLRLLERALALGQAEPLPTPPGQGVATAAVQRHQAAVRHREEDAGAPWPGITIPPSARKTSFSASEIEALLADPYSYYASSILRLKPLAGLAEMPGAAERGKILHGMMQNFCQTYPHAVPENGEELMQHLGRAEFIRHLNGDGSAESSPLWPFWQSRFRTIARFAVAELRNRQALIQTTQSEITGKILRPTPDGAIEIRAQADRVEWRQDGLVVVCDYKTSNSPPVIKDVLRGKRLQLLIYGLVAAHGGFHARFSDGLAAPTAAALVGLEYWHLSGRDAAARVMPLDFIPLDAEAQRQFFAHIEGQILALIDHYAKPDTEFTVPMHDADDDLPFISKNYAHLSRLAALG
ncbi:MAG: PD-(D/E)XK nuclease family protein [Candidatus Symbiobacter sp.]|nr:PD-(D/E)XK nuclease family protein [Candidatus Symbiobacter sp.]